MFMSSVPQGFVLGFTDGVTLGGDSTPVIDGICQPCMMGFSLHDPVAFSRSLGDRSGATQASQGLVIPCLDRASERRVAATELPIPGIDNRISTSGGADLDEGACPDDAFSGSQIC